jgi:hypothetical protein
MTIANHTILDQEHHKEVSLSLETFAICRVENLLCEAAREGYGKERH